MSGNSYDSRCPKCELTMDTYQDHKPYGTIEHQCVNCGFYTTVMEGRYTLEELNEIRAEYYERFECEDHLDMGEFSCKDCRTKSQLKELPKIDFVDRKTQERKILDKVKERLYYTDMDNKEILIFIKEQELIETNL